jgi:hypothetical protein
LFVNDNYYPFRQDRVQVFFDSSYYKNGTTSEVDFLVTPIKYLDSTIYGGELLKSDALVLYSTKSILDGKYDQYNYYQALYFENFTVTLVRMDYYRSSDSSFVRSGWQYYVTPIKNTYCCIDKCCHSSDYRLLTFSFGVPPSLSL